METTTSPRSRRRIVLSCPHGSLLAAALAIVAGACTGEFPMDELADARMVDDDPDAELAPAPDAAAPEAPDAAGPAIIVGAARYTVEWSPSYTSCGGGPLEALPDVLQLPATDAEDVVFSSTRCASAPAAADVTVMGDVLRLASTILTDCTGATEELRVMTFTVDDGVLGGTAATQRVGASSPCRTGWELAGVRR